MPMRQRQHSRSPSRTTLTTGMQTTRPLPNATLPGEPLLTAQSKPPKLLTTTLIEKPKKSVPACTTFERLGRLNG